jgi:hypothetical protein
MFLDDSEIAENTSEVPKETSNGQDTSCYQLSNGGQIHDVRNVAFNLVLILFPGVIWTFLILTSL